MKKLSFAKLYFYATFAVCFLMNTKLLQAQEQLPIGIDNDVKVALHILQDLRHEFEHFPTDESHSDLIIHIAVNAFVEMYQKIVEATVTYYLMPNMPAKQNLHDIIIRIIADDTIRLIALLCRELIHFIFDHQMSWQEKAYHCAWVISVILIIKMGVENLPKSINPTGMIQDNGNKNDEKPFWPKGRPDFPH